MHEQTRLFRLAPDAIAVACVYTHGRGWRTSITVRRSGEEWENSDTRRYEDLTSDELVQVLGDDLIAALGL